MKPVPAILLLVLAACHTGHAQALRQQKTVVARRGYYLLKTSVPVVPGSSPLAALANRTLSAWAQAQQRAFLAQARQSLGGGKPRYGPYESDIDSFSHTVALPRLVSIGLEDYQYADGAHGDTQRVTFNFALVNGQPKRLRLEDLFAPGTDARAQVQRLLLTKLHHDSRAQFIDEVKTFNTAQLNRFVIEHDGLRFWFDQYEVASYAAGPIDIKLSAAELGPDFRRDLLPSR